MSFDPTLSISDRIRALARAGHSRAEIARLVDRSYQQVRQVLVADEARARRAQSAILTPGTVSGVAEPAPVRYRVDPEPLPTRLSVDGLGRVQLPQQWRVSPGQVFIARKFGESIVLMDIANASEAARTGGRLDSVVDDFIAERRLEAMREFDD